ncbi:hypothetical protein QCA50_007824 [Cerrena zonata]|uniref:DNA polymerase V n=1 Tax=Cerrena zonata TaxID=2478898 RepID=A0AAW0GGC4_9APHY
MSTTLELFWNLSSNNKKERLDASAKLIGALERFQAEFVPKDSVETSEDDEGYQEGEEKKGDGLDALNAQDVSYSIRRLVRGLASPRESSRLGFAVALTELLSRLDTITCSQVVALILDSSKTQGSMTGQEERDVLFARLFGLTAVIQSGLLVRTTALSSSASSATEVSNLASFLEVNTELLALGEKRSWLRESAWWTIGLAIDALGASTVPWKDDTFTALLEQVYTENKVWTPEKVALTLKLQKLRPDADWRKLLSPPFKHPELVHTGNYTVLSRILKEVSVDEDEDADVKSKTASWKPQVHYVWDVLLSEVLADSSKGSFPELFRILVDESLFSSTASPQRKYWGFQIFQKALSRISASDLPMVFTKNFMRSWINHLSNSDRYLHKIAKQVANDIQNLVKKDPTLGFALLLQLTGVHGSHQFDKLTRTKTVESILTSMDNEGIQRYIKHLLGQVNDGHGSEMSDVQAINARRTWVIDQLAALIRNGAIPKDDAWVQAVLDWFTVHGLFIVRKQSDKSEFLALHSIPTPTFSDELHKLCRERLLSCLGDLTNLTTVVKNDDVAIKVSAAASDGQFWVSKVLNTIDRLEKDSKYATRLTETNPEFQQKTRELTSRLGKITGDQHEAAKGASLLVEATLLHQLCANEDGDSDENALQNCVDGASRMFPLEAKKTKKSRKPVSATETTEETDAPEPIDVLVDTILGFLEKGTTYMRAVANHVFSILSGSAKESTIDLIVAQLARKDPSELLEDDDADEEMEGGPDGDEDEEDSNNDSESAEDEEEEEDMEDDPELRRKIEEALRVNGVEPATGDSEDESDEELMDDEQMMAIDEQLAAVFKARSDEKRQNKGTGGAQREAVHYKNRVLDLVDIFLKKQPTSSHVIQLILPLTELIVDTSSDEKQLADKATGILRSRIGKSKEIPTGIDKEEALVILQEIHTRARKAPSSDVLTTLNQCSLFITRLLLHQSDAEPEVAKIYQESLNDFVTRKASRLNTTFLQDFIRRYAGVAWNLRTELIDVCKQAVNGYRQTQVFQLLHTLVNQVFSLGDHNEEILAFIPSLRGSINDALTEACSKGFLTPPQVKEVLKSALATVRQTRKLLSAPEDMAKVWDRSSWEDLSKQFASSESLKAASGLPNLCKQLIQALDRPVTHSDDKGLSSATKRKADDSDHDEADAATKKTRRKKVKKNKASS